MATTTITSVTATTTAISHYTTSSAVTTATTTNTTTTTTTATNHCYPCRCIANKPPLTTPPSPPPPSPPSPPPPPPPLPMALVLRNTLQRWLWQFNSRGIRETDPSDPPRQIRSNMRTG
ncbi:hypothetical protein E2C01_045381 [Portunus trituberculatus]|uniref:Uncharacterized protein n=1 Tax=Portunus trituberculatus TaxID=210409 RepID=A0A5B7G2Q2_PORTR|nr:hypothetical protein [Portunus trituberculatus]